MSQQYSSKLYATTPASKTYLLGTYTSPVDIMRSAKLMINEDLQRDGLDGVQGFVPTPEALDQPHGAIIFSHWTATIPV